MVRFVRPSWCLVAVVSMAVGVALEASAAPAQGICDGRGQIVPGQRVGPITLGMPLPEAQASLRGGVGPKRPPLSPTLANLGFFEGPNEGLTLIAHNDRIAEITLRAQGVLANCRTAEGIHVGSTASDIRQVFGAPPSQWANVFIWVYNGRGLAFSFTPPSAEKPNMAYEMKIYQPGHFCEISELLAKTGWASGCEHFTPRP
jgi:hypothetical protein